MSTHGCCTISNPIAATAERSRSPTGGGGRCGKNSSAPWRGSWNGSSSFHVSIVLAPFAFRANRGGPDFNVLGQHRAIGCGAAVAVFPAVDVVQVLLARQECSV